MARSKVRLKFLSVRYTAVQDAGKVIHPSYVEGQIQGGAAQGIGWALNEEYIFNAKGHMLNCSFLDYRMPVCLDLPMLDEVCSPYLPQCRGEPTVQVTGRTSAK